MVFDFNKTLESNIGELVSISDGSWGKNYVKSIPAWYELKVISMPREWKEAIAFPEKKILSLEGEVEIPKNSCAVIIDWWIGHAKIPSGGYGKRWLYRVLWESQALWIGSDFVTDIDDMHPSEVNS